MVTNFSPSNYNVIYELKRTNGDHISDLCFMCAVNAAIGGDPKEIEIVAHTINIDFFCEMCESNIICI